MKRILIIILIGFTTLSVSAQRKKAEAGSKPATYKVKADTLPSRTVTVTSAFQPSLKTTAKINFGGATPLPDSVRPVLPYDVPAQNLVFSYQSPELKPLAQQID